MDETWEFLKRRCDNAQRDYDLAAHRVAAAVERQHAADTIDAERRVRDELADWRRVGNTYAATVNALCAHRSRDRQATFEAIQ